eukprot:8095371-Karenia_brevis.AAC.1
MPPWDEPSLIPGGGSLHNGSKGPGHCRTYMFIAGVFERQTSVLRRPAGNTIHVWKMSFLGRAALNQSIKAIHGGAWGHRGV